MNRGQVTYVIAAIDINKFYVTKCIGCNRNERKQKEQRIGIHELLYKTRVRSGAQEGS